jgi:hypothetical protein
VHPGFVLEIHPLPLQHQRALVPVGTDGTDVLAENALEINLTDLKKKGTNRPGPECRLGPVTETSLYTRWPRPHEAAHGRPAHPAKRDQPQGHLRQVGDTYYRHVTEPGEVS